MGGSFVIERIIVSDIDVRICHVTTRINERFGQSPKASEATSRSYLTLHTPASLAGSPQLANSIILEGAGS